jgi:hypothetical protein
MPIDVTFKGRGFELKIEIPLSQKIFNNEGEKLQSLFQTIESISRKEMLITPQFFKFKGDETNDNHKLFEVYEGEKRIKFVGTNQHTNYNHSFPLPKTGIF